MPILIVVLALLTLVLPGKAYPFEEPQSPTGVRNLSRLLERERKKSGLPAVAAVLIQKGRIVAQGVAGLRKLGRAEQARLGIVGISDPAPSP